MTDEDRGSITLIQCAVHDFAGLLVCRLLMGCFEAGFMGEMPPIHRHIKALRLTDQLEQLLSDPILQTKRDSPSVSPSSTAPWPSPAPSQASSPSASSKPTRNTCTAGNISSSSKAVAHYSSPRAQSGPYRKAARNATSSTRLTHTLPIAAVAGWFRSYSR